MTVSKMRAAILTQLAHFCFSVTQKEIVTVRSVFDDDPLVQEHLAEAGPDWNLVPRDPGCDHHQLRSQCRGLTSCQTRALDTIRLLAECRRECRDIGEEDDKEEIGEFGGSGDYLDQQFGFRLSVCDLREGYSEIKMGATQINYKKFIQEIVKFIPAFTEQGFHKTRVPEALHRNLVKFRDESLVNGNLETESPDPGVINGPTVIQNTRTQQSRQIWINRTLMMELDTETRREVFRTLGPLAEAWSGLKLNPTSIYGIRRYRNMSTLLAHVDQTRSHVISAIINVDQKVEEDWPLYIQDNKGEDHEVILRPGEMIWYESARLIHSRQRPLRGQHYDNVFIHYKPRGLWYDR